MNIVFQQAPFDERLDDEKIKKLARNFEDHFNKCTGILYNTCDKCGERYKGISNVIDGSFTCAKCLFKDEVEKTFKEADNGHD